MKIKEKRKKRIFTFIVLLIVLQGIRITTVFPQSNFGRKIKDLERQSIESKIIIDAMKFAKDGYPFEMINIKGGAFIMGYKDYDLSTLHTVKLSSFKLGKTEVTQCQWEAVMHHNPSHFRGSNLPVETVSWNDVQVFLEKLNQLTNKRYCLPSEAEWEYAAGGGSGNRTCFAGATTEENLEFYAWYNYNAKETTHPVATKRPNALGLYDMSGNVCEWVNDRFRYKYYKTNTKTDPKGPIKGNLRVYRDGSWNSDTQRCEVSERYNYYPTGHGDDIGFRLAILP